MLLCSVPSQIHWAREWPSLKKGVIEMYLTDPLAEKYRQMDLKANGGILPEDTVFNAHICFCLVRPTYDQCADPIYTQVRVLFRFLFLDPCLLTPVSSHPSCRSPSECASNGW